MRADVRTSIIGLWTESTKESRGADTVGRSFAPRREVPQFVNILRGEMSAVGPRPLTADDVARFGWSGQEFDFRWTCRPGLTGLAQLLGARADGEALLMDRVHANGSSLWLDCQLIAWSFAVNAFGKVRVRRWLRVRYSNRPDGTVAG